jgi:hypothetical protein
MWVCRFAEGSVSKTRILQLLQQRKSRDEIKSWNTCMMSMEDHAVKRVRKLLDEKGEQPVNMQVQFRWHGASGKANLNCRAGFSLPVLITLWWRLQRRLSVRCCMRNARV